MPNIKKNVDLQKKNNHLPSPDNQGIEIENPKNVDEAAAEVNRDIGALLKMYPNKKTKNSQNKSSNNK